MKIIKKFEKIGKLPYEKKMPKHDPTDSYFHLARKLAKCMMRSGYTKINAPSSYVNVTDEEKSKGIIVHGTLSENNSMEVSKSERNIFNETLSQNNSKDVPDNFITELK